MDTGAAAAAFSPPIFRPALPSFTWQTPRATFGVLIVRQRRSLRSSVSLFAALHAPSFLLGIRASLPLLLPPDTRAFAHFPPPAPSPFEKSRSLAFMTGTHLLAVRRLHKGTNVAFLPGLSGRSNARGDRGLATGIRIFDPFSLSLSVFLSPPLPLCVLASIDRKENPAKLDCLRWKKI